MNIGVTNPHKPDSNPVSITSCILLNKNIWLLPIQLHEIKNFNIK